MNIEIKKLDDKGVVPSIDSNGLNLTCMDILTEVGKDGRLILIYRTGISVAVPENHIGLIAPIRTSPLYSMIDAAGPQIITSTYDGELIARYKVNTDSVPAIFEPGEVFARLIFIQVAGNLSITEVVVPVEDEAAVEDKNEVLESPVAEVEETEAEETAETL